MIVSIVFPPEKVNAIFGFCFLFSDISKPSVEIFSAFLRPNPASNLWKPLKLMFAALVLPLAGF